MHLHERNAEKRRVNGLIATSPMRVFGAFGELGRRVEEVLGLGATPEEIAETGGQ